MDKITFHYFVFLFCLLHIEIYWCWSWALLAGLSIHLHQSRENFMSITSEDSPWDANPWWASKTERSGCSKDTGRVLEQSSKGQKKKNWASVKMTWKEKPWMRKGEAGEAKRSASSLKHCTHSVMSPCVAKINGTSTLILTIWVFIYLSEHTTAQVFIHHLWVII